MSTMNLISGGFLLAVSINRLFVHKNPGWFPWLAIIVGSLLLGLEAWKWWQRRQAATASGDEDDDHPLRSLVFLLEEPRTIEPGAWVGQLGAALGAELNAHGDESTEFLLPMPHPNIPPEDGDCFMLKIPEGVFWVFNIRKPYMDNPEEFAESIPDRRLREAVAQHQAWISVDLLQWSGPDDRTGAYAVIGKALAALAGPDVLAINAPELGRCNEFDPGLIEQLAGGDPLAIFEHPTHAPIFNIGSSDPEMVAATQTARRRWPEFAALFSQRDPASEAPFIVKAPFGSPGEEEFMWVEVEAIEDDFIRGKLANQPHRILDLHEGHEVTVPVGAITDWLCASPDGKPLGGWTQMVLSKRAQ